jgi:tellurite resistance-related uncharacterized protein
MERSIVGFDQDDAGEWVARLSCLHGQHVRHQPPFRPAPWVLEEADRAARVGSMLDCPLCDRAELPADLRVVRATALWDERTMPAGLRRSHRVAPGVWGRLQVRKGQLRFRADTYPPLDVAVAPGTEQAIPPEVEHEVEPLGEVSFLIEFLRR